MSLLFKVIDCVLPAEVLTAKAKKKKLFHMVKKLELDIGVLPLGCVKDQIILLTSFPFDCSSDVVIHVETTTKIFIHLTCFCEAL